MNKNNYLSNISSKYILKGIFHYIGINFKMKLFFYSKFFQEKVDLELFDYQQLYLQLKNINLLDYFSCYNEVYGYANYFSKNFLKDKLLNDALKNKFEPKNLDIKFFEKFNQKIKKPEKMNYIDIYSPFFYSISLTESFGDIFIIPLEIEAIEKYNLKNDYKIAFQNLNKSNSKYFSLHFSYKTVNDINHLTEYENLFKKIDYLEIRPYKYADISNHDLLLKDLFSLKDFSNNLIKLRIEFQQIKIENNIIENLNNFKKLEELTFDGFKLTEKFVLKLNKLTKISFKNCVNFAFEEDSLLNLKKLNLIMCRILESKSLLKLPQLEECNIEQNNYKIKYYTIFDFSSIKNLKILFCDVTNFIHLEKINLEVLKFRASNLFSLDEEKKMFEKFLVIPTLKEIQFWLVNLNDNEISKINGHNNSVKKITIIQYNESNSSFYNIQEKFPNLSEITIDNKLLTSLNNNDGIEINENKNYKIKNITIKAKKYIKLYCGPYKELESLQLYFYYPIKNIENDISIFKNNQIIFESLKSFCFDHEDYNIKNQDDIEFIIDIIKKMPNLKEFIFKFKCIEIFFNKEFFTNIIRKILSSKLELIVLEIFKKNDLKDYLSFDELKKIYPELKQNIDRKILIMKYNFEKKKYFSLNRLLSK